MEERFEKPQPRTQAAAVAKPDFDDFEAMMCAACMTPANAGKMVGCDLEEFLARFLA